jgi:hypothetical protein
MMRAMAHVDKGGRMIAVSDSGVKPGWRRVALEWGRSSVCAAWLVKFATSKYNQNV